MRRRKINILRPQRELISLRTHVVEAGKKANLKKLKVKKVLFGSPNVADLPLRLIQGHPKLK